jgi:hypothetical protein
VSWKPFEGGRGAAAAREAGLLLALVTSTISRPRASIPAALSGAGVAVTAAEVVAAPVIAAADLAALSGCPVPAAQQRDE